MNLIEAFEYSRETGGGVMREGKNFCGFITWGSRFTYKLTGDDVLAEDWVTCEEGISKLTNGKWSSVGPLK